MDLAKTGKRAVVIERKYVGGSCPNIACLPSKNIIHSAKVASYFWRSGEFGITKDNTHIDMSGVRDRKRKMVDGLVAMHLENFKASGAELLKGSGRFTGPRTVEVELAEGGTRLLRGERVIISTGSRTKIEPIPGLIEASPLTHIEALDLDHVPERLLIIGGGYIGLELAQAMRRFGSHVTIIERNPRLAHRKDQDVTDLLHDAFREEGIEIVASARINRVEGQSGKLVKLYAVQNESEIILEGTHLLVAGGRTPNTQGIGLELAAVETTDRGYVKVNERLETTASGVWAVGDCAGSPRSRSCALGRCPKLEDFSKPSSIPRAIAFSASLLSEWGRRDHRDCPGRDASRFTIYDLARLYLHPSYVAGGIHPTVLECATQAIIAKFDRKRVRVAGL